MHELSIVLNIVDIVEQEAHKAGADSVSAIELDIGKLSTIEPAAFEFAWKHGIRESVLEGVHLTINYISGRGTCRECNTNFEMEALFNPCPDCGSFFPEITDGQQMSIKSMRIEDSIKT
jgi:hydrogenase nickel incorporation protein HypA/HybF